MEKQEAFMRKTWVVWLGVLICCALWGSAFPCIKIGYRLFQIQADATGTQILFAGCRFTLAGILTILIGSALSKKLLLPKKGSGLKILKLSMLQTVGQYVFFYIGLAHISGVKASIIGSMNVFFAILIASLLFHQEQLTMKKLIGSLFGFAGVVMVNMNSGQLDMAFHFAGDGSIILSTVAYAFSSVFLKRYSKEENPVVLSGYQFILGGIIMIVAGLLMGGKLTVVSGRGIGMLIYLAFVSAIAYSLWGILLKYNPVSKVTIFGFMNPVFGVILSAIFLQEADKVGPVCLIALAFVCVGIFVVNYQKEGKNS